MCRLLTLISSVHVLSCATSTSLVWPKGNRTCIQTHTSVSSLFLSSPVVRSICSSVHLSIFVSSVTGCLIDEINMTAGCSDGHQTMTTNHACLVSFPFFLCLNLFRLTSPFLCMGVGRRNGLYPISCLVRMACHATNNSCARSKGHRQLSGMRAR